MRFNTSHVEVHQETVSIENNFLNRFNTSHVEVHPPKSLHLFYPMFGFNTSHVEVHLYTVIIILNCHSVSIHLMLKFIVYYKFICKQYC